MMLRFLTSFSTHREVLINTAKICIALVHKSLRHTFQGSETYCKNHHPSFLLSYTELVSSYLTGKGTQDPDFNSKPLLANKRATNCALVMSKTENL